MKKRIKPLSIIGSIFQWLLVITLVFVSSSLILSKYNNAFRYRVFTIDSGSMEPELSQGSLAFVKQSIDYKENDIITYSDDQDASLFTTHRVVKKSYDRDNNLTSYQTKGDANTTPDLGFVNNSKIIGSVVFSLPHLGSVVNFAKTQEGFIALIVVPSTILIYSEMVSIKKEIALAHLEFKENRKKKKKSGSKEEEKINALI